MNPPSHLTIVSEPARGLPRCHRALLGLGLFLSFGQIQAQSVWDGGTSGLGSSWNSAANWVGDTLPGSGANLLFNNRTGGGVLPALSVGSNRTVGTVTFDNTNSALPSTLNIETNGSGGSTARTLTVNSGITLSNTVTSVVFNANVNGTLSLLMGGTATMNTALAGSSLTLQPTISGTAGMIKSGAGTLILVGANTYQGGLSIQGGTVMITNTSGSGTGTGNVTVGSGSSLRGTGTISGAITVSSGGTLSPGTATIGTLNTGAIMFDAGGKLQLRLNGNGSNDRLNAAPALLTMDTGALIEVIFDVTYTASERHSFDLMEWGSLTSDGNLADQINLPTLAGGLVWNTSLLNSQGIISVVAIVPEPSKSLLFAAGVILWLYRRRRSAVSIER